MDFLAHLETNGQLLLGLTWPGRGGSESLLLVNYVSSSLGGLDATLAAGIWIMVYLGRPVYPLLELDCLEAGRSITITIFRNAGMLGRAT